MNTPVKPPFAAVIGPSFPPALKLLATLLLLALIVAAVQAQDRLAETSWPPSAWGLALAAAALALAGWAAVVFGTTEIGPEAIRQRGLWRQEARLDEIRQLRLVHLGGLEWLMVPRLLVRTRGLGLFGFTAGNAELLAAFRKLAYGESPD